jgi:membrane protease YdiL (CAAX protease family)
MEFAVLFAGIPLAGVWLMRALRVDETPVLAGAVPLAIALTCAGACGMYLWSDPTFDRRQLWRGRADRFDVVAMLGLFVGVALGVLSGVSILKPQWFLWLPRNQPGAWMLFVFTYPLVSVYPQELIYRPFLFHRYRALFGEGRAMIAASAISFGYMHILFGNPVAVALTLAGGCIFAWRYRRTRSTLLASAEHALYGVLIFTAGLGQFFYGGTLQLVGR